MRRVLVLFLLVGSVAYAQDADSNRSKVPSLIGFSVGFFARHLETQLADQSFSFSLYGQEVSFEGVRFWPSNDRVGLRGQVSLGAGYSGELVSFGSSVLVADSDYALSVSGRFGPGFAFGGESVSVILAPIVGLSTDFASFGRSISVASAEQSIAESGDQQVLMFSADVGVDVIVTVPVTSSWWVMVGGSIDVSAFSYLSSNLEGSPRIERSDDQTAVFSGWSGKGFIGVVRKLGSQVLLRNT